MEKQNIQNGQANIEGEEQSKKMVTAHFKIYCKATIITIV